MPMALPLRTGGPSETGFWAYGYPFAWVSRRLKGVGGMGRISALAGWRKSGLLVFALATVAVLAASPAATEREDIRHHAPRIQSRATGTRGRHTPRQRVGTRLRAGNPVVGLRQRGGFLHVIATGRHESEAQCQWRGSADGDRLQPQLDEFPGGDRNDPRCAVHLRDRERHDRRLAAGARDYRPGGGRLVRGRRGLQGARDCDGRERPAALRDGLPQRTG